MENEKKLVYVPMAVDTIHPGHLNIINKAAQLGNVMVGLFTDEAIASYKKIPVMNYEQRKSVVESIKGVDQVVKQETRDYEPNLRKFKPHYMVHGTDWREGPLATVREKAIAVMAEWNGEVVEPEYTEGISSSGLHKHMEKRGVSPLQRQEKLKKYIELKEYIRVIGIHDGLSGTIAEKAAIKLPGEPLKDFEALYIDAKNCALSRGLGNKERLDFSEFFNIISQVMEVTSKPIIVKDNSIDIMEFERSIKKYENLGVSALVIPESRIKMANDLRISDGFLIIAEIECESIDKAMQFKDAGADAIMVRGKLDSYNQVSKFKEIPIIATITEEENLNNVNLKELGYKAVVYRNSIYPVMCNCIEEEMNVILKNDFL